MTIVCGIPHEQAAEFVRLAVSGRPGDYTELLRRLDAMIPAASRLRAEALARFFDRPRRSRSPPEQLTGKLIEIAGRYQDLLGSARDHGLGRPRDAAAEGAAAEALDGGDFARTEEFLNRGQARGLRPSSRCRLPTAGRA